MRPGLLLTCCLICSAIVDAASKSAQNDNYFVFPIDVKHNQIRRRGLLEAGKVEIDGSVRVGYFYAVLPLGTPPKPFNVIVDTGSTVTYVPCYDCAHCGRHNDAPFNPKQSATSRWVQCSDSQCRRQRSVYYCDDDSSNQCAYRISYAEQSSSEGKLVQDVFSFPNNGTNTKVPVVFGCESSETGEIYRQKPDGILGMGNNPGAFHSQLATAGAIPHMFSLCFGFPSGGAMLLGNAPVPGNPTYSWTRLSASGWGDFYAVDVDRIAYAGAPLDIPKDTFRSGYRTVMDSGTTFIYLTTPAYQKFAAAVTAAAAAAGFARVNDGYGDICWRGAPADFEGLGSYFPDASFEFADGGRLALPAYRYMFQLAKKGTYCLAVFDNGDAGALIGGVATRNVLVQYDIDNQRVGFADMDCQALGEMPAPLFNLAKPAPKAAPVAATAAEPATAAATPPPAAVAAAGTADAAASNPPEAPTAAKQVPAIQLQQQQDTANEKLVLPLSEEAIEKDLEVLGKAAEVYDEAYEEAIDIMEKAAKQVETMVEAAVGTSKTNASSSSSNSNSSVPGDASAAAAATVSKDAAAAAAAAPAAATSVLNPAHIPAAVAAEEETETLASSQDEVPTDSSSSTASSSAEGVVPATNQSEVPAAAVDQSGTVTTAPATAAPAAAAGSSDASSSMNTTTAAIPAQEEPSSSSSSSAPSTTAAVSEDLLVPSGTSSGTAAAIVAANSSTNATVEDPAPETVHWGTGSTQFSSADLHGGEKVLMGDTSPVAAVVLFVLLGALLLAVAGVVAVVLRRRQIKAAGFSQLSATEIDCELAGISRRPAAAGLSDYDTDGGTRLIGSSDSHRQQQQRQQYGGSSSGSSSRYTNGVAGRSQHSGLSVQPNAADDASAANGVDAVKSPVGGRDQQSPKPENMAGLLPPPPRLGRTAASGAAQGLLPPPPQQQQQQRRVPSAVGATDVVAMYSLDHDDDHKHGDQSPAAPEAAAASAAGAAGAVTSAAAAASEGLTAAMSSEQSMELISLHEDAPKDI